MAIRFLAIDGFNLIRRIYEARHVATRDDMTSVIEAAVSSVRRAIKTHTPGHAAVVLEHHDRTWRHLLYPEYKANRSETPPLLLEFLPEFRAGFESAGVASWRGRHSVDGQDFSATVVGQGRGL
jgi:5'-3' exonuclease